MKKHFHYLRYLIRHKWFVFHAGIYTGAPLWRLLIHDWTKFLPCEWFPYVEMFYGKSPDNAGKVFSSFSRAWLHHQHWNKHHWQYWILKEDDGGSFALPMPERYWREMVADWMGAGRAINGRWEADDWYKTKGESNMVLDPDTKVKVWNLLSATCRTMRGDK